MTDTETLDAIWRAMDGAEWNADLWDIVATLVLATGRAPFRNPEEG